ncbi:MAG: MqnA/MqnD/SBP family protein [Thermoplasmataceae archaeon]
MKLVIAHTPDPDDSFMFYGMFEHKIKTHYEYDQVVKDIETLNKEAVKELYDVTAISANGYAAVSDKYYLTTSGASFGLNYGPIVVAKKTVDLRKAKVATPGFLTSSYLLYRMFAPEPAGGFVETRFDRIPEAVLSGKVDAGILIHDEQLTYQKRGLIKVFDVYEEWKKFAGSLPVPLGFNAIKKSLGRDVAMNYKEDFENSIKFSMKNEDAAVNYSLKYARYQDMELERKFIRMYVNDLSIDFGKAGREALSKYYARATEMKLLPHVNLEII